jgi:ABC-type transport system involved in multi-copper enzyme maturation permease subunit
MLLPNEMESRTIYTILSKPVRRFEFLLGKYLGSVLLTLVSLVLMCLMFVAVLAFKEQRLTGELRQQAAVTPAAEAQQELQHQIQRIRAEAFDRDIVKAVLLIFVKLCLLAAITLLVSTFSTSMVFNVAVALLVFFAGHLVGIAKEVWQQYAVINYLLSVIPDLGLFNLADDVILGKVIPWSHVGKVSVYGLVYLGAVIGAAHLIFANREI